MRKKLPLFLVFLLVISLTIQPLADTVFYTSSNISSPEFLSSFEVDIYDQVQSYLGSDYYIEDVHAIYISKEYLSELSYNSKSNIYFGYTLEEIEAQFSGERFIFTLGEDGKTVVKPFEGYDDTFDQVVKNIAVGSGVILISIVVSTVSGGLGAPAISLVFATSAKTATTYAVSSGIISAVATAAITGYQTKDMTQALKAAALKGSESFKWSAISGALSGAALETITLHIATRGGLTANEAATIIKQHDLSADFVKQIHSMEEYTTMLEAAKKGGLTIEQMAEIYRTTKYPVSVIKNMKSIEEANIYFEQAHLSAINVGGTTALVNTDMFTKEFLVFQSESAGTMYTNLERMNDLGLPPIDPATGKALEVHHIGQLVDSPLAVLTQDLHRSKGYYSKLHSQDVENGVHKLLSNSQWSKQKEIFWKEIGKMYRGMQK